MHGPGATERGVRDTAVNKTDTGLWERQTLNKRLPPFGSLYKMIIMYLAVGIGRASLNSWHLSQA